MEYLVLVGHQTHRVRKVSVIDSCVYVQKITSSFYPEKIDESGYFDELAG